jgi:hypothetical protein
MTDIHKITRFRYRFDLDVKEENDKKFIQLLLTDVDDSSNCYNTCFEYPNTIEDCLFMVMVKVSMDSIFNHITNKDSKFITATKKLDKNLSKENLEELKKVLLEMTDKLL